MPRTSHIQRLALLAASTGVAAAGVLVPTSAFAAPATTAPSISVAHGDHGHHGQHDESYKPPAGTPKHRIGTSTKTTETTTTTKTPRGTTTTKTTETQTKLKIGHKVLHSTTTTTTVTSKTNKFR